MAQSFDDDAFDEAVNTRLRDRKLPDDDETKTKIAAELNKIFTLNVIKDLLREKLPAEVANNAAMLQLLNEAAP